MSSSTRWAYLAGVTDADGSLGIARYGIPNHTHYKPFIDIACDPLLMGWLQKNIAEGTTNKKENCWQWRIFQKALILDILNHILPYLTTKKAEALILQRYLLMTPRIWSKSEKEAIYQELKRFRRNRMIEKWVELGKLEPQQALLLPKEIYRG